MVGSVAKLVAEGGVAVPASPAELLGEVAMVMEEAMVAEEAAPATAGVG